MEKPKASPTEAQAQAPTVLRVQQIAVVINLSVAAVRLMTALSWETWRLARFACCQLCSAAAAGQRSDLAPVGHSCASPCGSSGLPLGRLGVLGRGMLGRSLNRRRVLARLTAPH